MITDYCQCRLAERPRPKSKDNFIVIKVHVAPMCNEYVAYRDLDFRERNRKDSLGHEAAGEVIETGSSNRVIIGQRVVALCGYPCGSCELCREGFYSHCASTIDPLKETDSEAGACGFSQFMLKPDWLLVPIPDDMSYEHASMACCGLGPTFGAMELMNVKEPCTVLITGLGPVGLGGVINGVLRSARVIGVARNPYRTKLAKELGAFVVINPEKDNVKNSIMDLTDGVGVDCAIECSSNESYQRIAIDMTRRKGQVTFLAESGLLKIHVDNDLIQKGLTLRGSLDINLNDAQKLLGHIKDARHLIDKYITHRYPLAEIDKAWEQQISGRCGKIILYPWK